MVREHYLRQFFDTGHLGEDLRPTGELFRALAQVIDEELPKNSESATCLRKLLEARDCALRALLYEGKG
jgi:hypothetical protein